MIKKQAGNSKPSNPCRHAEIKSTDYNLAQGEIYQILSQISFKEVEMLVASFKSFRSRVGSISQKLEFQVAKFFGSTWRYTKEGLLLEFWPQPHNQVGRDLQSYTN